MSSPHRNPVSIRYRFSRIAALLALCICVGMWSGCFVPPTAIMQSARVPEKGEMRITPYYSSVKESGAGGSEDLVDQFGFLFGISAGNTEWQLRYERTQFSGENDGYNFTSIGPKIAWFDNRFAFMIPAGLYWAEGVGGDTFQIQPGFIGTVPIDRYVELSAAARYILAPSTDVDDWAILNFNAGLSSDVTRWAVIPEIGISWDVSTPDLDPLVNFSIALAVYTK